MRCAIFGSVLLGFSAVALPRLSLLAFADQPNQTQDCLPCERRVQDRDDDPLPAFTAVARLGTLRLKQGEKINSIAFAPDGKSVASVSGEIMGDSPEVRVWSAIDGRLVRQLELLDVRLPRDSAFSCHPSEGSAPVFAPDGNALALPCDTRVLVWDIKGLGSARLLGKDKRYVNGCAFSPDGTLLAWGSVDHRPSRPLHMIVVCEAATGKQLREITTPSRVEKLCGSPKDAIVAAALEDGTAGLWDISKGTRLWPAAKNRDTRVPLDHGKIQLVGFSADGQTFATASANEIVIWRVSTGEKLLSIPQGDQMVDDLAFVPPGRLLAALGQGYLTVWNATTGNRVDQMEIPGWCRRIALSPDGKLLARPFGCTVVLRRFPENTDPLGILGHMDMVPFVAYLSGNVLVSWGRDCKTFLWDVAATKPIWELSNQDRYAPVPFGPQAVAVSRQRNQLAIAFRGRAVEIWNTAERKREKTLPVAARQLLSALQFSPDGNSLACGDLDGNLLVFDVQSGRTIRRWSRDEWLRHDKGEERSTEALPWRGDKTIRITVTGDGLEIQSLAWSPDGKIVVSASPRKVRWLEVRTGKVVRESSGSSDNEFQRYATFSPNGKMLAELDNSMRCVVVDAASGRELWNDKDVEATFNGSTIAFSPDSTLLAGGCCGDSIRLVDATTGKQRAMLATNEGKIEGVGFSADGHFLAAGGRSGTILVFDVARVLASKPGRFTESELGKPESRPADYRPWTVQGHVP